MIIDECFSVNTNGGNKEQKLTQGQKRTLVLVR